MLTVLCVKWGDKYSGIYVTKLRNMAARYLPPHEFVCITDKAVEGINCIPLVCDLPTWWSKIGLFQPGLFPGENLYLDLDVVITGPVNLPELNGKVWASDDFSYSLRKPRQGLDAAFIAFLGGIGTCNSSVMYWEGDAGSKAWEKFTPDVMTKVHGDQNYLTQALYPEHMELFPDGVTCSYKYHVKNGTQPAPIVVFHGAPKPADLPRNDPLRQAWL